MSLAEGVDVSPATLEDRRALGNLMQLYIHDFSEFWWDREDGDLGADGRFGDYPLDAYWREPGRIPLLLRRGGKLVGFALINAHGHTSRPVDHNVAEFFIARKHRRGGVGTAAARTIYSRYPGAWETAVARRNTGAQAFWRQAITGHPKATEIEELDLTTDAWNGPLFRFRILP